MYKTVIKLTYEDCRHLMRDVFNSPSFDNYTIHKIAYTLFPIEDSTNFVFDAEHSDESGITILLYSDKKPVIPKILEEFEWSVQAIDVDEIFKAGNAYRFEINVNPVRRSNGKVCGFVHDDEMGDWLEKKMNLNGASIEFSDELGRSFKNMVVNRKYHRLTYTKQASKGFNVAVSHCMGVLRITDAEKFKKALVSGIGKERAFGLGMLIVV